MAKVKFYASLRNKTGVPEKEVEAQDIKELLERLSSDFGPEVSKYLRMCTVLVNGRNVIHIKGKKTHLKGDDTVSIFPPLGGG